MAIETAVQWVDTRGIRFGISRVYPMFASVLALLVWAAPASATFPGENGKLTFEASQIFTVNPDGSDQTALTEPFGGVVGREPAFSPDGRLIAFDHSGAPAGQEGWGIWVMNADGSGKRQISREPQETATFDTSPTWSPDGRHIAFVRNRDLLVMNADGTGVRNLTDTFDRSVLDPEWSPRGNLIAFSDGGDLYVIGADGSQPTLITSLPGNQNYPSWSPDGSMIAHSNIGQVARVNADGSNEVVLLDERREVWDIAWSPDGSQIAFVEDPGTNIEVQEELYRMNADGTGVRAIGVDTNISLDWGVRAAGPSPPVLGETATIREVKGRVFVGIPSSGARAAQKGIDFVPLEEARGIPIGSFLDTRRGTVALTTARDRAGRAQTGRFTAGLFQVLQSRKRQAKGLTELRMKGSAAAFRRCRSSRNASASALSRRTIRRLRAKARGRYRSRGRHSAATVRGTTWTMEDRCDGTLTTVKRGKVAVRDFRRKRTVVLTRGKSYLAAPRK